MSALGSLVVKLGLDYAQYTGGLDKSEQAALSAAKKIQDTFDGMKARVAATAGAIAGGLAAGFTISAFRSIISGSIETGAALDDLRMQTGATVEALSGLVAVGKFNNMGPEQIGAAMNKLASNLASATEEGKGAGKALEALGIDFDKFKMMRPEDQMQTVAKAMAGFEDGTGKAAVAMALYGKQGAQMLPFLHDLAEVGDLQAKVSTEQAAAAANLDDNLTRLSTSGEAWKKELANGMIPALDLGAQALVDMMNGSGGLREEVRRLVADGSIKQWTTDAIKGLSYVADVGQIAWRVLQSIGKGLGGLAAALVQALSGDFRSAWATLQASGQDMIDVFDGPTVGARFRESLDKVAASAAATGDAAAKARPSLDGFANTTDKAGKAATAAKDPFDALRDSIIKATAAYQAEATAGEKLTEGQKKAIDVLDQLRTGKVKVTEAQAIQIGKDIEAMLAAERENKAREESVKISQAAADARRKEADAIADFLRAQEEAASAALHAVQDRIISLRDEEQAVEISRSLNISLAEAVERVALARLQEKQARFVEGSDGWEAIQREITARKELMGLVSGKVQRENEARGWADMWQSVDRTAHDVFVNVLDGGQDAFKRLGNTLKASVLDVLYQMTVRKWIISIGTSVLGSGFGAAANAATGAAGGSVLGSAGTSMLGSMMGGASALGIGASYGFQSLFANGLGATLSAGTSMIGAGSVMSGLGTIAGALGPIALGVGAVVSLIKKLDDSGTMHTGALSQYSAAGGLASSTTHGAFGMGFGGVDYSAETEKFTGAMAQSIVQMLDSTATTFGKEAGYKAATAFADDTSKDGAWGGLLITKLEETIVNWDPTRTSRWAPKEFADGAAGKEQYLAAVAADVRVALDSIGLPAWATGMLEKLGQGASIEQLAGAVDQINAAKAAFASFGQYMPTFAGLADSAISKLVDASGGAQALAGNMATFVDQFYSDADKLAVNTENVRAAMGRLGFEMPRTREEFAALVQANVALGDAGAETVAKLLQVAGAFAQVTPAVESASAALEAEARAKEETARAQQQAADDAARRAQEVARERYGLETELYTLLDNTNKLRERELATLDSSNRALKEFIYSLQDAFAAVDNAFATVQRSVAAQKNALAAEFEAGQAQRQKALSDAQSVSGLVDNISRAISNAVAAQSIDSKAFDVARRSQAQARLDGFLAALRAGGSVTELPGLDRVLGTLGKDSKAGFGRFEDYAYDRGVTAGKLAELGLLADAQKTVAEKTLEEITAGNEAAQTAYAAQQAALDATLAQAQSMYDAMKGIDTSVLSVAAAMQQFSETLINLEEIRSARSVQRALMQQGSGDSAGGSGREYTDAELAALGFDPADIRAYAQQAANAGLSSARGGLEGVINEIIGAGQQAIDIAMGLNLTGGTTTKYGSYSDMGAYLSQFSDAQRVAASEAYANGGANGVSAAELQAILSGVGTTAQSQTYSASNSLAFEDFLKDMPKFADGGIHAGGWRLVGERGPELEYTPPSRIYNAADTISLLQSGGASNAEIAAALREMAARLEAVEANSRAAANASAATQRQLQGVVQNGAIRVRNVA